MIDKQWQFRHTHSTRSQIGGEIRLHFSLSLSMLNAVCDDARLFRGIHTHVHSCAIVPSTMRPWCSLILVFCFPFWRGTWRYGVGCRQMWNEMKMHKILPGLGFTSRAYTITPLAHFFHSIVRVPMYRTQHIHVAPITRCAPECFEQNSHIYAVANTHTWNRSQGIFHICKLQYGMPCVGVSSLSGITALENDHCPRLSSSRESSCWLSWLLKSKIP